MAGNLNLDQKETNGIESLNSELAARLDPNNNFGPKFISSFLFENNRLETVAVIDATTTTTTTIKLSG